MKSKKEKVYAGKIILASVGAVGIMVCVGCKSEQVLVDRPYIPAPSDQLPDASVGTLPPFGPVGPAIVSELPPFPEVKPEQLSYTVKKGDSFWKIGRMYGVSMQELAAGNNMDLKKVLKVGTVLKIPSGGALIPEDNRPPLPKKSLSKPSSPKVSVAAEDLPADGTYTVKNGDSLWKIAKKLNTSVNALASANGIDSKTPLQVGQKLNVPGSGASTTSSSYATKPAADSGSETSSFDTSIPSKPSSEDDKIMEDFGIETPAPVPTDLAPSTTPSSDLSTTPTETFSSKAATPFEEMAEGIPHTVKENDTWVKISSLYGVRVEELKKANPKANITGEPAAGSVINIPAE